MSGDIWKMIRDKIAAALAKSLVGVYDCTRVWEAWEVGTMTKDDFQQADHERIADEVVEELKKDILTAPSIAIPEAPALLLDPEFTRLIHKITRSDKR